LIHYPFLLVNSSKSFPKQAKFKGDSLAVDNIQTLIIHLFPLGAANLHPGILETLLPFHLKELYMPLFEFTCKTCHETFEEITSSTSRQTIICPKCGSRDVQKLLSATVQTGKGSSLSAGSSCSGSGGFS
jgi:putative FmdB family regulatory protein